MDTKYVEGFIAKCAEHKIDPEAVAKTAGVVGEFGNAMFNPISAIGSPVGAAAALFTKTREPKEQLSADKEWIKNMLVPGRASYNYWKRLGGSSSYARKAESNKLRRR